MADETDPDLDCMSRLAGGEDEALEELFARHGGVVYGVARRIVSDVQLAEEVVQDAFIRVARDARDYRPSTAGALPWLTRIARNAALDVVRKRRRGARASDPEWLEVLADQRTAGALDGVVLAELTTEVKKALAELPVGPRKAVDLAYFSGLTQNEIAKELEVPLGTAKTWVRNGLSGLRERLVGFLGERSSS